MAYRLVITEHADELLDGLIYHLIFRLKNGQAARHLLEEIGHIYERLENNPAQFRVIMKNGAPGGYAAGAEKKAVLLRLEKKAMIF